MSGQEGNMCLSFLYRAGSRSMSLEGPSIERCRYYI